MKHEKLERVVDCDERAWMGRGLEEGEKGRAGERDGRGLVVKWVQNCT